MKRFVMMMLTVAMLGGAVAPGGAWDATWTDQFGTPGMDLAGAVTSGPWGTYLAGSTGGSLAAAPDGRADAYVRKYGASGTLEWTRQFGTAGIDYANGVVSDGQALYTAGHTDGAFPGRTSSGNWDVFVRKHDTAGNEVWTTQFGTAGSDWTQFEGLALHATGLYVTGISSGVFPGSTAGGSDRFIARLNPGSGVLEWVRGLGVAQASPGGGISVADEGIFIASWQQYPDRRQSFVHRYDHEGNLIWQRSFWSYPGCSATLWDVATWDGSVYALGQWNEQYAADPAGCTPNGYEPVVGVLIAFDSDGAEQWRRIIKAGTEVGSEAFTGAKRLYASSAGIFVGSNVAGTFPGHRPDTPRMSRGDCSGLTWGHQFADKLDGYVRKYRHNGDVAWTHQFGSDVFDLPTAMDAAGGMLIVAGETSCDIDEQYEFQGGYRDVFVIAFALEPTTPLGRTQAIVGMLETLRDRGRFVPGSFNSLVGKLETAAADLDRGNSDSARHALARFADQARRLGRSGELTHDESSRLATAADTLAASL